MNEVLSVRIKASLSDIRQAFGETKRIGRDTASDLIRSSRSIEGANRGLSQSYDRVGRHAIAAARQQASAAGQVGRAWGQARTALMGYLTAQAGLSVVMQSVQAADAQVGAVRAYGFATGDKIGAAKFPTRVRDFADTYGIRASDARQTMLGMVGAGIDPQNIEGILKGFLALAAKSNAGNDQIQRGMTQFLQIASQGKLQGDELRILQENMIQMRSLLQDAGLGSRIGSQTDPITFEEISKALLSFAETKEATEALAQAARDTKAELNRMSTAIEIDILAPLGKELSPAVRAVAKQIKEWAPNIGQWAIWIVQNIEKVVIGIAAAWLATKVIEGRLAMSKVAATKSFGTLAGAAEAAAASLNRLAGAGAARGGGGGISPLPVPGGGGTGPVSGSSYGGRLPPGIDGTRNPNLRPVTWTGSAAGIGGGGVAAAKMGMGLAVAEAAGATLVLAGMTALGIGIADALGTYLAGDIRRSLLYKFMARGLPSESELASPSKAYAYNEARRKAKREEELARAKGTWDPSWTTGSGRVNPDGTLKKPNAERELTQDDHRRINAALAAGAMQQAIG